jgi:hypothetical protein
MGIGTGTNDFPDGATNLTNGTAIQSGSYRKVPDSSIVTNSSINVLWTLEPGEPVIQPVSVGEFGYFKNNGTDASMGIGAKMNVPQIKDNTVRQKFRMTLKMNRITEVPK